MAGRGSAWRRFGRLATACLVLATCGVTAATASATGLPPEGIFENCNLDSEMSTCLQRLAVMHQGGFQVVVIPAAASPASLAEYASSAQQLGMSVMWEIGNPSWWTDPSTSTSMAGVYGGFEPLCGCNQNGALLAFLVHWLSQLPATYGYYAADDTMLSPGDQSGMASYVAEIKQQDPAHMVMIGSADETQTSSYVRIADAIGTDIYPVTTGSLMPLTAHQDMWGSVAQWASDAQHTADGAGKQSAFILQAFTWGDNLSDGETIGACTTADTPLSCDAKLRYPSAAEQLQLRNEVLLHAHPKLILWWSFPGTDGQATGDTYSIYPSGPEAAARWSGLTAAIQAPFPGARGSAPTGQARGLGAHIAGRHRRQQARRHRQHHHRHHRRHKRRHRRHG
jgi:hypothetical protein